MLLEVHRRDWIANITSQGSSGLRSWTVESSFCVKHDNDEFDFLKLVG